jgi:phosphoribosylanthranilate isomerase
VHRTRIKICGITRAQDALAAASAGADAIGMIFYKAAPRFVTPEVAQEIRNALPPFVTPVGVFVNPSLAEVTRPRLQTVQFNGDEAPQFIKQFGQLEVIKAIRVDPETIERELDRWRSAMREKEISRISLVMEPANTGQAGGTGIANDWDTVRRLLDEGKFAGLPPLIAAGGLTPDTVGAVVRQIRPWAVDVSSGVESSKGIKSAEKIRAFIEAVRAADADQ